MKIAASILAFFIFVLAISSLFLNKNIPKRTPSPESKSQQESKATILLGGDVMLARSVMTKSIKAGDYAYPFSKIADFTKDADIFFVNLENPIVSGCPKTDSGFKFCADPKMIEGLLFAGVDVVTLANNHAGNYGQEGIEETKKFLDQSGIKFVGFDNLETIKVGDIKIGLLGLDFLTNTPKDSDFKLISESKKEVDFLVVGIHWGVEYRYEPESYQKELAKKIIESGADAIAGHHPHWVQKIEYIEGKPIYYSFGNLVFDQMWSEETKKGLLVKLTVNKNGKIVNEEFIKTYMSAFAQPELVPRPGFEPG